MTFEYESAVKELQAKDEIRDLVYSYCEAIRNRDIESLVTLYTPDATFGSMGTGEDALRVRVGEIALEHDLRHHREPRERVVNRPTPRVV